MFELESENLTNLGAPMGQEYTYPNWRKNFTTMEKAKQYAEKDYKKQGGNKEIKWTRGTSNCRTEDMGFVMYHIRKLKVVS